MKIPKITLFVFFLVLMDNFLFLGCINRKESKFDINALIEKYSKNLSDSLKLECAIFLKENMNDIISETTTFYNLKTKQEVNISFDLIKSDSGIFRIMQQNNLTLKTQKLYDTAFMSNDLIEKNIEEAIVSWNKYPWNKNAPKDVFMNFLLPYKILNEKPENWRDYFFYKYKDSINYRLAKYFSDTSKNYLIDPNDLYYQIIVDDVGRWFNYNLTFTKLDEAPSLSELLYTKKGDCLQSAYLSTYILRSIGIPTAIDIVPIWGSRNSGHASEVFWDGKSRMRAASGRNFDRPAKVFRLSFKKQNIWKDSISPYVKKDSFLLSNLKNNHWLDVTGEHTNTITVQYTIRKNISVSFAYICVDNYEEWQPIYWGIVDKNNNVSFKNMGCNMLYRFAVPDGEGYKIISQVLKVDSLGNSSIYNGPKEKTHQNLYLTKLNTGARTWVEKGKDYALYFLDKKDNWQKAGTQICTKDSIITFKNIPTNGFYRLIDLNSNHKLERIFTYENGEQKWW